MRFVQPDCDSSQHKNAEECKDWLYLTPDGTCADSCPVGGRSGFVDGESGTVY